MIETTLDTGGVDTAVMALLASDQPLVDLLGSAAVFADVSPQGIKQFVIVSVVEHLDAYEFLTSAYETEWIMVKAVTAGTASRATAKAAAARCHALLQGGANLAVPGYRVMDVTRERFIDGTEYDERSQTWWQHVGGLFVVQLTPADPAVDPFDEVVAL
jgi:hypothetical protein